jgi:citrate lyase subunit beta / citryl-CoA lyase
MLRAAGATTLMLAKTSSAADLAALPGFEVIALCETVAGVVNAPSIAAEPNCSAMFWGGEDLVADMGGRRSRDREGRYHPAVQVARSTVLFAAVAARRPAIDAVFLDIADHDGLAEEAAGACDMGFTAKACIHPQQVPVVRQAFRPDDEQLEWAHALLEQAGRLGGGVFTFRGQMVDGPLYRQAENIIRRQGPT